MIIIDFLFMATDFNLMTAYVKFFFALGMLISRNFVLESRI